VSCFPAVFEVRMFLELARLSALSAALLSKSLMACLVG